MIKDELFDDGLQAVMAGKYHDVTQEPTPVQKKQARENVQKSHEIPVEATWEPARVDWLYYLKKCCKCLAIFGGISLGCFWGIQTGNMSGSMGWPIVYACTAVGAFMLGKYFKEAMKNE